MTSPSDDLNIYLSRARDSLDRGEVGAFVIGNEAADLDSMVSAILYGRLVSARGAPGAPPAVPVVNCARGDFVLRTEAVYLFASQGLDVEALVFIDEIDFEALYRTGRLRLTLVDHNVLAAAQAGFADSVEAIIDHHADGGLYPQAEPRWIEPVGSAATLVAEAMLRDNPALVDRGAARLLLGTILLDTVNLDPAAERATAKDRAMAAQLGKAAGPDTEGLFARLQAEKFNISALDTQDLLRKDYKAWDTPLGPYGMSSVTSSLADWVARDPGLAAGLDAFLRSRGLACLLATMAYSDAGGVFRRELAVHVPDLVLAAGLIAMLEASDLGLNRIRPAGLIDPGPVLFYTQRNATISRKKLQPLLQRFFSAQTND